ncbi:MAG: hypothetical protein HN704_01755 [Bacteroidetes bacterium]|jgi:hypothetical protein|nr:hypothetical protein [Bacteroidota bacterium]MBT6685438.1 hypothetical protein [Bacteroidota bacterium]MBT7143807.1 hypothetical protein [Bacteroidota bacterium]MBT7490311.1 hypothetical protein [Bacteroidota bacterium]
MNKIFQASKIKLFSLLFLTLLFFLKCDKQDSPVPYVYVNLSIYLDDPAFVDLKIPGNSVNITGGVNGIVVYRVSDVEFVAFDRTCTYQVEENCHVNTDDSGIFLVDEECCSARFSILDGSPQEGLAKYPLLQYQTSLNGYLLRIFN